MDTIDLRIDGGTQPRERLDEATVQRYAEAMADGLWDFARLSDAAVAFFDGSNHWLADGFHRLEAAKRAGKLDDFAACLDIQQGTQRDAILHSVGANAHHGFFRTDDDKRRAVSRLLGDPEWSKWSDREIARRCRVTHPFVAKLRRALTGNITSDADRTYATKHGTTATMDTSRIGRAAPKPAATQPADVEPDDDPATLEQPEADDRTAPKPVGDASPPGRRGADAASLELTAMRRRRNQAYLTVVQAIRAIAAFDGTGDLDELPWLLRGDGNQVIDGHLLLSQTEFVVERLQTMITALRRVVGQEGGAGRLH